jgi:hypothetical protein
MAGCQAVCLVLGCPTADSVAVTWQWQLSDQQYGLLTHALMRTSSDYCVIAE